MFFKNVAGWTIDLNEDESLPKTQHTSDGRDENGSHIKPSEIEILNQPVPASLQRLIELMRDAEDKKT